MIALLVGVLCLIVGLLGGVQGMLVMYKGKAESGEALELGSEIWRLVKVKCDEQNSEA